MPLGIKASILQFLCNNLLERPSIRAEIDRRESNGEIYAGKGGVSGAFPIMTDKEREKANAKALKMQRTDANTEKCVLCGLGGVLMCCDDCPAAYHMRCAGESDRVLDGKKWSCPECIAGGRGESAGLRLAAAGYLPAIRDRINLLNGLVLRSKAPDVTSVGSSAMESGDPWVHVYFGEEKIAVMSCMKRPRKSKLIQSSFDSVENFPVWPADELPTSLHGYTNRYANGWSAATAAIRSHVEDTRKRRSRDKLWIPNGTCNKVFVSELPVPMSISRYQWFQLNITPLGRTTIRCGRCHTCLRPFLKKHCLDPTVSKDDKLETLNKSKYGYFKSYMRCAMRIVS